MKISRDRRSEQDHALQVRSSCGSQPLDKVSNLFFWNHSHPRLLPTATASTTTGTAATEPAKTPPPNPPPPHPPPLDPPPPNIPEKRIQKSTVRSGVKRTISMTIISRITPPA